MLDLSSLRLKTRSVGLFFWGRIACFHKAERERISAFRSRSFFKLRGHERVEALGIFMLDRSFALGLEIGPWTAPCGGG
jgi:hypothetical protein